MIWEVKYKVVKGIETVAYGIKNDTEEKIVSKEDFICMLKNNEIDKFSYYKGSDGHDYIISENDWEGVEIHKHTDENTMTLVCELVDDDGETVGYMVKQSTGQRLRLSIAKFWEKAMCGSIKDVRAYTINGNMTVEGLNGYKMYKIPRLTV